MNDDIAGWQQTLVMFLEEIFLLLKGVLPQSYAKADEALRTLGESVYPEDIFQQWHDPF